jgi:mono/diheme cytochrome c family protein
MWRGGTGAMARAWAVALGLQLATADVVAQGAGIPAPREPEAAKDAGAEMYRGYCAPCHGTTGTGDGPAAAALRNRPTDLSRLSARNQGRFPADRVSAVLEFGVSVSAHGSAEMPTWGSTFRVLGDQAGVRERIRALSRYLESIQVK